MRIGWYIGNEEDHKYYCTTEGELPHEGSTVYLRDEKMASSMGIVIRANHCVGKGEVSIDRIEFPAEMHDPLERLEFASEWVEKTFGGVMNGLDPKTRTFPYATQRGEVIVRLEKPVGVPEQKE